LSIPCRSMRVLGVARNMIDPRLAVDTIPATVPLLLFTVEEVTRLLTAV
jgi:hypothetical protein